MPQRERPEEVAARKRVEAVLGVTLTFADLLGGVDYRFETNGRPCALEVTRLTDAAVKQGKLAWVACNQMYQAPTLRQSWWAVTEGYPKYKGLGQRLESALGVLERHNLHEYEASGMDWWMRQVPTLQQALAVLQAARVEQAKPIPTKLPGSQIHLSPTGEWMSDGPDGTVMELDGFLASEANADVRRKLRGSQAEERHVFVWVDLETLGRVRRPLEEDWGLPSRPPSLPEEITDVWLVDEVAGRGWRWSPAAGWAWVPEAPG